jgi:hypothetical protein
MRDLPKTNPMFLNKITKVNLYTDKKVAKMKDRSHKKDLCQI